MAVRKSGVEGAPQGPSSNAEFEQVVARLLSKSKDEDDFYVAKEPLIHSVESMSAIQKLRTRVIEYVKELPTDEAIAQAEYMLRSQREVHSNIFLQQETSKLLTAIVTLFTLFQMINTASGLRK